MCVHTVSFGNYIAKSLGESPAASQLNILGVNFIYD